VDSSPFHVKHLPRDAARFGLTLSDQQVDRLRTFLRLLRDRAIPSGLVAASDRNRLYSRHLLDCLRAAGLFKETDLRACDLGPGAGLPGVVLAVALPGCRFALIESKRRAAGFLELAVERLDLKNVEVVVARVEDVRQQVDVATARAFAPPERSWAAAHPVLRPGGRLIYFGGGGLADDPIERLDEPEPPASIRLASPVDSFAPLVIMSRRR
jgi:16S rRNA (guanine527-N7)-methyltransferase